MLVAKENASKWKSTQLHITCRQLKKFPPGWCHGHSRAVGNPPFSSIASMKALVTTTVSVALASVFLKCWYWVSSVRFPIVTPGPSTALGACAETQ